MKQIIQNEVNGTVPGIVMVKIRMILRNVAPRITRKDAVVDQRTDVDEVDRKSDAVVVARRNDDAVNQRNKYGKTSVMVENLNFTISTTFCFCASG